MTGRGRELDLAKLGFALCAAAVASLLWASFADARTRTVRGGVAGDANARVLIKVKVTRGGPVKVTKFRATRLDHTCTDGLNREFNVAYRGRLKINKFGNRRTFFGVSQSPSGRPAPNSLFVTGKPNRSARRIKGEIASTIRFPSLLPSGETSCTSGPGPATAAGNVRYNAR